MFFGFLIFGALAVVCVVVGVVAMKRQRDYGDSEPDDDFDFDKYEGFDT
jgi:hypothetical protein